MSGEKSHVGMEANVCVVCGQVFDTGAILLDMRLKDSLERQNVTGWGMCPEHEKLREDGYIALVGCDEKKSNLKGPESAVQPEDAYRTGLVAHLKRAAFENVFDVPVPKKGVCFCPDEVIEMLKEMECRAGA